MYVSFEYMPFVFYWHSDGPCIQVLVCSPTMRKSDCVHVICCQISILYIKIYSVLCCYPMQEPWSWAGLDTGRCSRVSAFYGMYDHGPDHQTRCADDGSAEEIQVLQDKLEINVTATSGDRRRHWKASESTTLKSSDNPALSLLRLV